MNTKALDFSKKPPRLPEIVASGLVKSKDQQMVFKSSEVRHKHDLTVGTPFDKAGLLFVHKILLYNGAAAVFIGLHRAVTH